MATTTFQCTECPGTGRKFATQAALAQHKRDSPAHLDQIVQQMTNMLLSGDAQDFVGQQRSAGDNSSGQTRAVATSGGASSNARSSRHQRSRVDSVVQSNVGQAGGVQVMSQDRRTATVLRKTFDIWPSLHAEVVQRLQPHDLTFTFFPEDTATGVTNKTFDNVIGSFKCYNPAHRHRALHEWTGAATVTVRLYGAHSYNARVYYQRCRLCNRLARPKLGEVYVENVSNQLLRWSGRHVPSRDRARVTKAPHQSDFCEGCKAKCCPLM